MDLGLAHAASTAPSPETSCVHGALCPSSLCKTTSEAVTYREQHVLLVLVDSTQVGDGVRVFDHRHGLPCRDKSGEMNCSTPPSQPPQQHSATKSSEHPPRGWQSALKMRVAEQRPLYLQDEELRTERGAFIMPRLIIFEILWVISFKGFSTAYHKDNVIKRKPSGVTSP